MPTDRVVTGPGDVPEKNDATHAGSCVCVWGGGGVTHPHWAHGLWVEAIYIDHSVPFWFWLYQMYVI